MNGPTNSPRPLSPIAAADREDTTIGRAGFVAFAALSIGIGVVASAAGSPAVLLHPLTEADQARIQETGCESAFSIGPRTYLFAMNDRMTVRTAGGAAVCDVGAEALNAFLESTGSMTCGGVTVALKHIGRRIANSESDSVSGPSLLVVTRGSTRQRLRGESGTAC